MRTCGVAVVWWMVMLGQSDAQELTRERAVAMATAELMRVVGMAEASIAVVDATAAQWRDSSLGCPQRGMAYEPVITPGYRVTLRAGNGRHSVHVGAGRAVLCGTPLRGDARDGKLARPSPTAGLKLAEQARTDAAARLGIPPERIAINFFRPTTWPDAQLGCPAPAGEAAPQPQPVRGFLIELSAAGTTYEYHADQTRVVRCEPRGRR